MRGAASFGAKACARVTDVWAFSNCSSYMSPGSDHGAVEGVGRGKIFRLCQGQLKLSSLEGNARCGQICAQRGGQHEKQRCKRGQDADAAQKNEQHEMA
jgi:hypothetical protein